MTSTKTGVDSATPFERYAVSAVSIKTMTTRDFVLDVEMPYQADSDDNRLIADEILARIADAEDRAFLGGMTEGDQLREAVRKVRRETQEERRT